MHAVECTRLQMGRPVDAELGKGEVEMWEFEGSAGQVVSIAAGSTAFSPKVARRRPVNIARRRTSTGTKSAWWQGCRQQAVSRLWQAGRTAGLVAMGWPFMP